jgi:hypothetical protein
MALPTFNVSRVYEPQPLTSPWTCGERLFAIATSLTLAPSGAVMTVVARCAIFLATLFFTSNLAGLEQPSVTNGDYDAGPMGTGLVMGVAQTETREQLNIEIARWRKRVEANPASSDAYFGLASAENTKADLANDRGARHAAADHFIKAAELALERGQIRYTSEVSRVLVALNDRARLDEIFSRMLLVAADHYLALVDYAEGLAGLRRQQESDARFEEAIRLYPASNSEAIGRYAQRLLGRGDARRALAILDQMSPEHRIMNGAPVFLRKRALEHLGLDTSSADAEIELVLRRGTPVQGGVRRPGLRGQP